MNRTELARLGQVNRARLTQIMNLLLQTSRPKSRQIDPSHPSAQRLAEVIAHFQRRVAEGPPTPKIATIQGLQDLLRQGP